MIDGVSKRHGMLDATHGGDTLMSVHSRRTSEPMVEMCKQYERCTIMMWAGVDEPQPPDVQDTPSVSSQPQGDIEGDASGGSA